LGWRAFWWGDLWGEKKSGREKKRGREREEKKWFKEEEKRESTEGVCRSVLVPGWSSPCTGPTRMTRRKRRRGREKETREQTGGTIGSSQRFDDSTWRRRRKGEGDCGMGARGMKARWRGVKEKRRERREKKRTNTKPAHFFVGSKWISRKNKYLVSRIFLCLLSTFSLSFFCSLSHFSLLFSVFFFLFSVFTPLKITFADITWWAFEWGDERRKEMDWRLFELEVVWSLWFQWKTGRLGWGQGTMSVHVKEEHILGSPFTVKIVEDGFISKPEELVLSRKWGGNGGKW
jgi:hypothetical protein